MNARDVTTDSVPSVKPNLYELARANGEDLRERYDTVLGDWASKQTA